MADRPWKVEERKKCRALGGERTGPTGRDCPDCTGIHVALEVKHYKKYVFLTKDWEQAVENAAKVGLPPVLNVRERGRGGRDCVQLDWKLFRFLYLKASQTLEGEVIDVTYIGDPPTLVRLGWSTFERLYQAAYIDTKE